MSLLILPASSRNAPGLLTARGWDALRSAATVVNSCAHPAWAAHLREAGVEAEVDLVFLQKPESSSATVCWLIDAESQLARTALDQAQTAGWHLTEIDFVFASPTAPGSEVVESVRIMHVLRSPGGDVWSAQQTHASLARYLLEETYELLECFDAGAPATETVNELGDLLFQILLHARLGMEAVTPWTIDDVARNLNQKLYRRTPHIFKADGSPADPEHRLDSIAEIEAAWQQAKQAEVAAAGNNNTSDLNNSFAEADLAKLAEGIPQALPALQRAFKLVHRAAGRGVLEQLHHQARVLAQREARFARALPVLELVISAEKSDDDLESDLRALLSQLLLADGTISP